MSMGRCDWAAGEDRGREGPSRRGKPAKAGRWGRRAEGQGAAELAGGRQQGPPQEWVKPGRARPPPPPG